MLQERLQAERHLAPRYDVVETLGPPHARTFRVEVVWDDERIGGEGQTIKAAEMDAARRALEGMDAATEGKQADNGEG
jgi:ribonuclease-3